MLNLGGHVLGFPSENVSSATKGESVADTIRVVSCYADIVAMRHPKEGAPLRASRYSRIPVINAGDGGHQHPTQTLTDLMTIRRRMGRLDDLTIGLCGDLKFGRTVHSPAQDHGTLQEHPLCADQPGGAAGAGLYHQRRAGGQRHPLQGDPQSGGIHAGTGHPVHDPRAEGALLQRGGLYPPEEQLCADPRKRWRRPSPPWRCCTPCPV